MKVPIFDLLPSFVDQDAWEEFKRMRSQDMKKPLSEYAEKLAMKKLTKWHGEGYDVNAIIDDSIFNNWQGLFHERHKPKSNGTFIEKATDRSWADEAVIVENRLLKRN